MSWQYWHKDGNRYINDAEFVYYPERYDKYVTVRKGYVSDGATGARDVDSKGWWVHDVVKESKRFDDDSECTNWQASNILSDILKSEGYWFRARSWFLATLLWGTVVH